MAEYAPWTTQRLSELRRLWATSATCAEIGLELGGVSAPCISNKAKEIGLPPRHTKGGGNLHRRRLNAVERAEIVVQRAAQRGAYSEYMTAEASRRGLSVDDLEARVLAVVAGDRMVDAILDDADEGAKHVVARAQKAVADEGPLVYYTKKGDRCVLSPEKPAASASSEDERIFGHKDSEAFRAPKPAPAPRAAPAPQPSRAFVPPRLVTDPHVGQLSGRQASRDLLADALRRTAALPKGAA